jgi:CubicO group peptidase (beta-lactamase class C family)
MLLLQCSGLGAEESFDPIRAQIEKARREENIPAIAVAVARHGKILWQEGFGWADRENRIPANEHTMFSLASISKPITATGLMILVQAGKIQLDRPINDYLGTAKLQARVGNARDATVRRVAAHTSGLPMHYQFFFADEPYRRPSMDETILRYGNLVTAPGQHYTYSNLGYGVLGYVIERVSGLSYAQFMRKELFLKLGMMHTSIDLAPGLDKFQAIRYDSNGTPLPFYDFDHPGASAVYASVHDLVRFGMFHLQDRLPDQSAVLSDASIVQMRPTVAGDAAEERDRGIGWYSADDTEYGYQVVSHSGGMPGVCTTLDLVPSEHIAVVVLSNTDCADAIAAIRDSIFKALLPAWQNNNDAEAPPEAGTRNDIEKLRGVWEGSVHTYAAELPLRMEYLQDGDVHVRLGDQQMTLLNDARFENNRLTGTMTGNIHTGDANRHPDYILRFALRRQDNVLSGGVIATSSRRDARHDFATTQWAELRKVPPAAARPRQCNAAANSGNESNISPIVCPDS